MDTLQHRSLVKFKMSNLYCIQTNDSVFQEDVGLNSFTDPSTTLPQHHQISQTIFWCVNNLTTRDDDDDMNREVIDISDDDEEEDENASQNGSVVCLDDDEIEVIELSDDGEDDELSGENSATLDNHEINQLSMNEQLQHQHPTDFDSLGPSTSQTEQYDSEEDNKNGTVSRKRVLITLGLSCHVCSKLFDIRPKLEKHLMKKHRKLHFKCMIRACNGQFAKRSLLNQHYAEHSTNQAKLICSAVDCQFETSIKNSFANHVYLYHEKGLFQCAPCLETYPYRFMVSNHYKKLHKHPQNIADKLFSCPVESCRFVGRNNFYLKQHQLTHAQLRPFRCTWPDCGFAMNYRSNFVKHIRGKHLYMPRTKKEGTQRNVQCNQDPRQFVEIFFET